MLNIRVFSQPSHYFPHGAGIIRFGVEKDGGFILCMRQETFGVVYSNGTVRLTGRGSKTGTAPGRVWDRSEFSPELLKRHSGGCVESFDIEKEDSGDVAT
jgi:hypothetical protein